MKQIKYTIIIGDSLKTNFMQVFDLFDKSKVFGDIFTLTATIDESENLTLERGLELINAIKTKKNKDKSFIVSYIQLIEIQDNEKITINTLYSPYFNPEVRIISNGKKWFLFNKFLQELGFITETTKDMYIKSVKIPN